MRARRLLASLLSLLAWVAVSPAAAQQQGAMPPSLTLSPSLAAGTLERGQLLGPFGLTNHTGATYRLTAFPVLFGQARNGQVYARVDPASRRAARRMVVAAPLSTRFVPGQQASARGAVRSRARGASFYGGLVFRAAPLRRARRGQITNLYQLSARIFLDPSARERRVRLRGSGSMRADQAGRRIALRMPVRNAGNARTVVRGRAVVRSARGRRVATVRLGSIGVLPGATVNLPGALKARLQEGRYRLVGVAWAGRHRVTARGALRIGSDGRVAFEAARVSKLDPPAVHPGRTTDVEARYRNTGTLPVTPRAIFLVRRTADGRVVARASGRVQRAARGKQGMIQARLPRLRTGAPLELTLQLRRGGRRLDERTVSVTPTEAAGPLAAAVGMVQTNALVLVGALLFTCLALGWAAVRPTRHQ